MPELAAHLERVAKELSERVVRALFDQGYLTGPTQDRLDAEDIAGEALKAGLAAALAACAREASVQGRNQGIAHCLQIVQNSRSTDEHANWLLKKLADTMGEALERAVGESK